MIAASVPVRGFAAERHLADQQLEEHAAERPDVDPLVERLAARLFGTHVGRRPQNHAGLRRSRHRHVAPVADFGETKIEHLHETVRRDFHVCRLQVAMDDALLVRRVEGVGYLPGDLERVGYGQPSSRADVIERLAFDELQDERLDCRTLGGGALFEAVDGGYVRMVE
jgi:hypothetical protein